MTMAGVEVAEAFTGGLHSRKIDPRHFACGTGRRIDCLTMSRRTWRKWVKCRNRPVPRSVLRSGNASPLASLAPVRRTGALWKTFIRVVVRVFPVALYRIQLLTKSLQNLYS